MITLAFYKGPGKLFDRLIRWVTKSIYSHVAIIINNDCYEADSWSGRVIKRLWQYNPANWDLFSVPDTDVQSVAEFLSDKVGHRYDYLGVIGFVFPWQPQVKSWWYCSELAAAAIGLKDISLSPGKLADIIKERLAVSEY